jgi:hypothetical protein
MSLFILRILPSPNILRDDFCDMASMHSLADEPRINVFWSRLSNDAFKA